MPWSSLQGVVETSRLHFAAAVFAREEKKKKKNVLCTVSNISIQLSFCLARLLNFIYLLMWHFCYTEHVSFIYRLCFFVFLKNIPLYNIYPVLYDYYYYFGGCRASGYV